MKSFFSHNRIILWILGFLLIMNITAVGSILFYRNKARSIVTNPPFPAQRLQKMHPEGRFMQKYLDLNEDQFEYYTRARNKFHKNARKIAMKIREKRLEMFDELKKTEPDRKKIGKLAEEIGMLHKEINIETGTYYLEVRDTCNPGQREKLNSFFLNTFNDTRPAPGHGRGQGRMPKNLRNQKLNSDKK
ncbi:MAG: periplasmic heavy metal sensor [Bacteroidales bacterium]